MHTHFLRAMFNTRKLTQSPAEGRDKGDPAGAIAPRRLSDRPRKASILEWKSTVMFNKAYNKVNPHFMVPGTGRGQIGGLSIWGGQFLLIFGHEGITQI